MKIALTGNPNVGKTTLFNTITGAHQEVANWPGTTVEMSSGKAKGNPDIEWVDLPGTYALAPYSEEERVARHYLLYEYPDAVVVVVDATRLERSLFLALEVIELTGQAVVALNMVNVAERQGIRIDHRKLQSMLGVPVIPVVATNGEGVPELIQTVMQVARKVYITHPEPVPYPDTVQTMRKRVRDEVSTSVLSQTFNPDWVALRLIQGDEDVVRSIEKIPASQMLVNLSISCCLDSAGVHDEYGNAALDLDQELLRQVCRQQEDIEMTVTDCKYKRIHQFVEEVVSGTYRGSYTERLDYVLMHPFWGYPVMGAIFFAVFWFSFIASAPLSDALSNLFLWFGEQTTVLLTHFHAPLWMNSFVIEGIFAGVGAVLGFVPYMAIFFALYHFLQDCGYMARASVLVDRLMQVLGLHGKGFFSFISAYGCNVPAMTATRIIENKRDRLLTNLLIPFIPCNARLGVMAMVTAAFFPGTRGAFAFLLLLLMSLGVIAGASLMYRKVVLPADPAPLLMEIPSYHLPAWRNVLIPTWHRVKDFVRRIWRFILWATIAIWFLTYFPLNVPVEASYAAIVGGWLSWIGEPFGFDWRLMIAILFGFVAKETTLATLGVLYGVGQAGAPLTALLTQAMTPLVAFSFLVIYMLYIPCLSTIIQMRKEMGSWKWVTLGSAVNVVTAFALGYMVILTGQWMGFSLL